MNQQTLWKDFNWYIYHQNQIYVKHSTSENIETELLNKYDMKIFLELLIPFQVLFKQQFLKSMFFLKAYPIMHVFFKNTIAG